MSTRAAFFWGGLGGLLPVLANLVTIDIAPIIDDLNRLTLGNYVGFGTRVSVLILLGGIIAVLNSDVRQPLALVQLGIAAPALITAYINAAPAMTRGALISFTTPAYAEDALPQKVQVASFLADFKNGLSTPLANVDQLNRAKTQVYPNIKADATATGTFCVTAQGKFGPGPSNPTGTPCVIQTPTGPLTGRVGQ